MNEVKYIVVNYAKGIYKFNLYVGNIENGLNELNEFNEADAEFYKQYNNVE